MRRRTNYSGERLAGLAPLGYGFNVSDFTTQCEFVKVDEELGLVFGFAVICKQGGEEYYDVQGDHITEAALLPAATDFAKHSRVSTDMHARVSPGVPEPDGDVVFMFPLTTEIAAALDIETPTTGLLVAMQPSGDVLAKFKSGEYTGFSIGGFYEEHEEVA